MPKVSVIIPVYNTEKYLRKCLDSVCNQTLSDIEIICINDCSTDGSLSILREYAQKDNRFKVIDFKENQGAAIARNLGIDEACGEYIAFLDSDDFYNLDFLEKLYSITQKENADIAKGCYFHFPDKLIIENINKKIQEDKNNFVCDYCSAIIKKQLLDKYNIRFPELCDMEDPVFAFLSAIKANKIAICNEAYVNIFHHSASQTAMPMTMARLKDKFEGFAKIIEIANENNIYPESYGYITALWFNGLFYNIDNLRLEERIFFRDNLINLYKKIKYKKNFLKEIKEYSESMIAMLLDEDFENIFVCFKNDIIAHQKALIDELELSQKNFEQYFAYTKKLIKKNLKNKKEDNIYFISVVNNYDLFNHCISQNPYITCCSNIAVIDFDNTKENISIPQRYNSFLDNYDYSEDAWFVFCHCDWELMDDINSVLQNLDKNCIYGPIGSKVVHYKDKTTRIQTGFCYERRRDGSGFRHLGFLKDGVEISDTFDCQCLIVHSSLVKKYNLRFDENLQWDLYAEDFSINAKKIYSVSSYALKLYCCHWSGYHSYTPASYYESLNYLLKKYPNDVYGGTVSFIGGKEIKKMGQKEELLFRLRSNIQKKSL